MGSPSPVLRPSTDEAGAQPAEPTGTGKVHASTRKQIRGSSLLFGGRLISLGVNFLTQVLIVRYLSKADFGIFAYGLTLVAMVEGIATIGMDKAVPRFLPIYQERDEYPKVFGTMLLAVSSVLVMGLAIVLVCIGLQGSSDGTERTVVLIMLLLGPVMALDTMLLSAFAVFSKAKAIFWRKYVVAPGLQLSAIVLVMLGDAGVEKLAIGYVSAGALGLVVYTGLLLRQLQTDGILARFERRALDFPVREIYAFALPLVAVDLMFVVQNTANIVMLKHFGSAVDVANYRVILPAAKLNMIVMTSFTILFTPLAARLYARDDRDGIRDLYWRTAAWMAVFSFPVFAMTTVSSEPLTTTLFGQRYEGSAVILSLLSIGYYFNAALGFNGLTLRVFGLVRYSVVIAVVALVANLVLNLLLIPPHGAVGAGIATCASLVFHNILKQAGLRKGTGISVFDPQHLRVYAVVIAGALLLLGVQLALHPGFVVDVVLVGIVSTVILLLTRESLRVGDTFPELLRVPLLRRILA
jgi:O-antigen/teichoic acid export membrane protein